MSHVPMAAATGPAQSTAGLRLAEVRVEGFRSLLDVRVPIGATTLLVGANNSGKTSFLEALAIAIGAHHADETDFHVAADGSAATRFVIDLRLEPATGNDFPDDLAQLFADAVQIPKEGPSFIALRTTLVREVGVGIALSRTYLRGWPTSRTDKVAEMPRKPSQAERERAIAFSFLDARRDVADDMRNRRSWWGRLTSRLDLGPDTARDIEASLASLGRRIVEESGLLAVVRDHLRGVQAALGTTDVAISPLAARLDDVARGMDVVLQAPGSASLPIARQGMGARSLASLLVFRTFVQVKQSGSGGRPPLAVTALEEPEAHVHPQGHRAVFRLISEIPGQRLVSTHSPYVAAPASIYDFRVFCRRGAEAVCRYIPPTRADGSPTISGDALDKIQRLLLRKNAEALFARVVVLFEGDTEGVLLPMLASRRWVDPDATGLSLVNMEGAGNLLHAVRLLQPLGIPWVVLTDGDQAGLDALAGIRAEAAPVVPSAVTLTSGGEGLKLEQYLIAEGHGPLMEEAIAREFEPNALESFGRRRQGQEKRGGGVYDYASPGGSARLLTDFMEDHKVRCGRAFGTLACERNVAVRAIEELFNVVDGFLGV